MDKFEFYLVTDTHFFAHELGCSGKEYDAFMDFEQKCFAETEEINNKLFDALCRQTEVNTVLIPGDLSFNGEYESHVKFERLLKKLRNSGKNVYVITAGHDIAKNPFAYPNSDRVKVRDTTFSELYDFYRPYGYDNALELNKEHLSYVADLNDRIRLLALCNDIEVDGEKKNNIEYDDEFIKWIDEKCAEAKRDGKILITMEHYPLLAGKPILNVAGNVRQKNAKRVLDTLADGGCRLVFTGHMHNQSVNSYTTEKGNKITDVCTGSVIGWPSFYRKVTVDLDTNTADIRSIEIPEFEHKDPELSSRDYLIRQFDAMIRNIVLSMQTDPARILRKFGVKAGKGVYPLVKFVGRILAKSTVGGAARLFSVKIKDFEMKTPENLTENQKLLREIEPLAFLNAAECKKVKILDLACALVRSIFEGDSPFTTDTVMGKAVIDVLTKLDKLVFRKLKIKGKQGEKIDLLDTLINSIGNYTEDDYDCTVEL